MTDLERVSLAALGLAADDPGRAGMLTYGWLVGTTVVGASVATAALLLWIVSRMGGSPSGKATADAEDFEHRLVALFDGPVLHDATEPARAALDSAEGDGDARSRMLRHLEARFGPLRGSVDDLEALGSLEIRSEDGAILRGRWCDGLTRLEVAEPPEPEGGPAPGLGAMEEELRTLRLAVETAPWPMWHTGPDGAVDWANAAYLERAAPTGGGPASGWPPPALFQGHGGRAEMHGGRGPDATGGLRPGGSGHRLRVADGTRAAAAEDDAETWFDCEARTGLAPGAAMHFAAPAGRAVRAERSLDQFVQTLTKTFAHLPVGLAVFDAKRGLSLFNPALTELTTLPVDFLSSGPSMHSFIDRLREARRMPEPRDWRSWRERITALEAAAGEGTYLETWNLPAGQTWRVSGRPHPDGAIALMFEDITSEIALTRRFRSELEIGQAVVDAMREAIAVFAPDGTLTLANEAYARLWDSDPRHTLGDIGVADASRGWMERSRPSPVWGELRDFVGQMGDRAAWSGEARLSDGRRLICRAAPLSGGATLIGFAVETAMPEIEAPTESELVPDAEIVTEADFGIRDGFEMGDHAVPIPTAAVPPAPEAAPAVLAAPGAASRPIDA
jgi:PAS domain-containing protein